MADEFLKIDVNNVKETQRKLFAFSNKLGKKITTDALKKGAQFVKKDIVRNAPKDSGRLKKSFVIRQGKRNNFRKNKTIEIRLYPLKGPGRKEINRERRTGAMNKKRGAYYAHMIEFGTVKKSGRYFILKAYNARKVQSSRLIINSIETAGQVLAKSL